MSETKNIKIFKNISEHTNQEALEMLKEECAGLQYDLLENGNILCYGYLRPNFQTPTFLVEVVNLNFKGLDDLNFLSDEIKGKVLTFMSIPICPECGVSLIEEEIVIRGDLAYRFNPMTKNFELDYVKVDQGYYSVCTSCWQEIEIDTFFDYHKVTFQKDEQGHLQVKEENKK